MTDIYTVSELIAELSELPGDAPVMICVVKYPDEFALRPDKSNEGELNWDTADDTEVHPLERGDVTLQRNMAYLVVELDEYSQTRAEIGG